MDAKEIQTVTVSLYLQLELRRRALQNVSAVEAASWLERAGILTDSRHRRGLPLRNLLRSGLILGQRQAGRWCSIDRVQLRSVDFRRAGG